VAETYRWAQARLTQLLDIKHHHVVFTLPAGLRPLAKQNSRLVYDLLFRCSSEVCRTGLPTKYRVKCGIVSVLHRQAANVKYHPHCTYCQWGRKQSGLIAGGGSDELPKDNL
jgi:hypothetical protein